MAAVTATILVGHGHPNDGGNRPFAMLKIEEGDRPSISLEWMSPRARMNLGRIQRTIMIPTLERCAEDVVIFVALVIARIPEVVALMPNTEEYESGTFSVRRIEMTKEHSEETRERLYSICMRAQNLPKLTFCIFEHSLLLDSAHKLANYQVEHEICVSTKTGLSQLLKQSPD